MVEDLCDDPRNHTLFHLLCTDDRRCIMFISFQQLQGQTIFYIQMSMR